MFCIKFCSHLAGFCRHVLCIKLCPNNTEGEESVGKVVFMPLSEVCLFTAPVFMKLQIAEWHYMDIFSARLYRNQWRNVECRGWNWKYDLHSRVLQILCFLANFNSCTEVHWNLRNNLASGTVSWIDGWMCSWCEIFFIYVVQHTT